MYPYVSKFDYKLQKSTLLVLGVDLKKKIVQTR